MRIICDHCDRPISGTVKRLTGNFNLHPACLAQFGKDFKHASTAVTSASQESSIGTLVEWGQSVLSVQERLGKS
jgi:hypothetical protein